MSWELCDDSLQIVWQFVSVSNLAKIALVAPSAAFVLSLLRVTSHCKWVAKNKFKYSQANLNGLRESLVPGPGLSQVACKCQLGQGPGKSSLLADSCPLFLLPQRHFPNEKSLPEMLTWLLCNLAMVLTIVYMMMLLVLLLFLLIVLLTAGHMVLSTRMSSRWLLALQRCRDPVRGHSSWTAGRIWWVRWHAGRLGLPVNNYYLILLMN